MMFHERPVRRHEAGKWAGVMTPYRWHVTEAGGWMITFGASAFLIAKGSGFSRAHGKRMLRMLEDEWRLRRRRLA